MTSTLRETLARPGVRDRAMRAAVAVLWAQGRSLRDFTQVWWRLSAGRLSLVGDGETIVTIDPEDRPLS